VHSLDDDARSRADEVMRSLREDPKLDAWAKRLQAQADTFLKNRTQAREQMNCTRLYSAARIADDLGPGADLIGLAAVTEVGISRRAAFERQRRLCRAHHQLSVVVV
jgi:hypothetical protein